MLTYLLLDKLKSSAPSRIIIVSSRIHTQGLINFSDLNSSKDYHKVDAYSQSKLANLLHQKELVKHLEGNVIIQILYNLFLKLLHSLKSTLSPLSLVHRVTGRPFPTTIPLSTPKGSLQRSDHSASL